MTGAVMTTFPFSPQFFEGTVLPALRDKKIGDTIAVLADAAQYDATLSNDSNPEKQDRFRSQQPRYIGQRYHFAPISVGPRRTFHPKIHYIAGERRIHATVASANITHTGLTHNQEIATQLTVKASDTDSESTDESENEILTNGEQAAICMDIADFLETLIESPFGRSVDPVTTGTIERTLAAGTWLEDIDTPPLDQQSIRFLHNLDRPLLSQVQEVIADRGEEIQQVEIATPFYGSSLSVPRLFTDNGINTRLWLQQGRTQIPIDDLESWLTNSTATALCYNANRYVHGKVICIRTNDTAYCLSGSPNASRAALLSSATNSNGNIEAALLRKMSDSNYFAYLFETALFADADTIEMDTFEPGIDFSRIENRTESDPSRETSDSTFELYGVSYHRRETYRGGTVIITGVATGPVQDTLLNDGAKLVIDPSDTNEDTATVRLHPHEFEWEEEDIQGAFTASTDQYGEAAEKPFTRTAQARLHCGENTTRPRWVQTHQPTTNAPTAEDIADAGAKSVPGAIAELYQSDADRRAEIVESLNGLLAALRTTTGEAVNTGVEGTRPNNKDKPSGGLRVRQWTQSKGRDPDDLIESFYEGWKSDIDEFGRAVNSDRYNFEEIETRLKAINAATLQLLLLDKARPELDVPRQASLSAIKEIYTEQDIRGQSISHIADYCATLRYYAKQSEDQAHRIYDGLQTYVLPHVVLAAIIAEAHIANNRETFFNQQDWAFEELISKCFPTGYPAPRHLSDEQIDATVIAIQEAIEGVRARIEESRKFSRHADIRYMNDARLRRAVIELLARSILYAGPSAVETYRDDPKHEDQIEEVFEDFVIFLPSSQQQQMERRL